MTNPPSNNQQPNPPTTSSSSSSPSSTPQPVDHKKTTTPPFNLEPQKKVDEKAHKDPSPWAADDPKKEKKKEKKDDQPLKDNDSSSSDSMAQYSAPSMGSVTTSDSKPSAFDPAISDLAKEISNYIQSMSISDSGKETTVSVTISSSSIFNGAEVQIRTVGGENNILFRNLNEQAQLLLENRSNMDHLRQSLEIKGVTVHVISTERADQPFGTRQSDSSEQDRGSRDDDQGRGGGQQGRQQRQGQ